MHRSKYTYLLIKLKRYRKYILEFTTRLDRQQFLVLLGIVIGLISGLVSILLKSFVHIINGLILDVYSFFNFKFLIVFFPMLGLAIVYYIIKYFFNGKLKKGVVNVLIDIAQRNSFIERSRIFSNFFTSAVTVGFGGSCGLEAPIVVIGSSIGSNGTKKFKLSHKERTLMLASGAAAGIAAVFNAPIAGVVFALEILLTNVNNSDLIALILASVAGVLCSYIFLSEDLMLNFQLQQSYGVYEIFYYVLLGVFCGLISLYYTQVNHQVEKQFASNNFIKNNKILVGGFGLAILCFFFPTLLGEGYTGIMKLTTINPEIIFNNSFVSNLLEYDWVFILLIGALMVLKMVAATITIHAGGNGGNFAPSLFVGAHAGYFFSAMINFMGFGALPKVNFMLAGMAGVLSGVMFAPLTGIFLIAEISGGYGQIVPLMIVSAFSFFIAKKYQPFPMETSNKSIQNKIFTSDKEQNILTKFELDALIQKNIYHINEDELIETLIPKLYVITVGIIPVVNKHQYVIGILNVLELQKLHLENKLYPEHAVKELMIYPDNLIGINENKKDILDKIVRSNNNHLIVVDKRKLVGIISKNEAFNAYRNALLKLS